MSLASIDAPAAVAGLAGFDAVIDARSPAEFALDHLPGAVNWPVLDDAERARVGTLYVQVSALEARKTGAALVARNVAAHIEAHVGGWPREWRPLVYCWRGGQRSGSLAHVLGQIGFRTSQLTGGYKAFRAVVRDELLALPGRLRFTVVCGRTGSGKTRLLQRLQQHGAQVLDLEALARHRGSILGGLPGQPQPSQKHFETQVWHALHGFDTTRTVFIESESARIGRLRVPEALLERMHGADSAHVLATMADDARTTLLLDDYAGHTADAEGFCTLLAALVDLQGRETVARWQAMARAGDWPALLAELMQRHYDPLYAKSLQRSYGSLAGASTVDLGDGGPVALDAAVAALIGTSGGTSGGTPGRTPGGAAP
jgi:tRNA 2-selenouridine synthase